MKRWFIYCLGLLLLALTTAGLYQFIRTKIDESKYPPPGHMVDVGGYQMHYISMGTPSQTKPTVVLDAGMGEFSLDWSLVQPEIAQFAHVISYDRTGLGWSDASLYPRSSRQVV